MAIAPGERDGAAWARALRAVQEESNFAPLNQLLESQEAQGKASGLDASVEWEGAFLTPLFVAVLLRLDDHIPRLLALGSDPGAHCFYEGFLCCPVHAAAMRGDQTTLNALLEAKCSPHVLAETSTMGGGAAASGSSVAESLGGGLAACNALHVLVARDCFEAEVYRLLLRSGVRLTAPCRTRAGEEFSGLLLPRRLGNMKATEARIDELLGEEVQLLLRAPRSAAAVNELLELGAILKKDKACSYRFCQDVDFTLFSSPQEGNWTALLYAADMGNAEAMRLLLYAGADAGRTVTRAVPYNAERVATLTLQAIHLAVLRADDLVLEHLFTFGVDPRSVCSAEVRLKGQEDVLERWSDLSLVHLAVLARMPQVVPTLLRHECHIAAPARCQALGWERGPEAVSPLLLAVMLGDVRCTAQLLDCGAPVDERIRAAAIGCEALCEMFGGPPVVGLEDWVSALLTGETALQQLLERRTDLCRALNWPNTATAMLERHRLAGPELIGRLVKLLEEVPTVLQSVCPVHLTCLLQQPWALRMLVDAGAPAAGAPPCHELPSAGVKGAAPGLEGVPLDLLFLSARVGSLQMLELLCSEPRFGADVRLAEIPLCPDLTPPFFPWHPASDASTAESDVGLPGGPIWAWSRLGPLELAILHRRVDAVVLLVRMGAPLLHFVDHLSIGAPANYSITEQCFRGLTPLHLCALLDNHSAAAALLNEACVDKVPVVENEHPRPRRQDLLAAVCTQGWHTLESGGDPAKEQWLWRDLTPLHLAILRKSLGVAELLVEVSTPQTLGMLCISKDVSSDAERSFSALLLAHEYSFKELHRKIAKRFPSC